MKYTHAILGGTGNIGAALSDKLIEGGQTVLIIGHDPKKAAEWEAKGATYAVADIMDHDRMRVLFGQAERLFLLNPPASPDTDIVDVEIKQISAILRAVRGLPLQKIVAASTYGARKGNDIADLGTLYELEQGLTDIETPVAIIRSAYYMSNFQSTLEAVKNEAKLFSMFPADFKLPMVAPEDIGHFAADLLMDERVGIFYIEGPEPYSNAHAANVLSAILKKTVTVETIPASNWFEFFKQGGFSDSAARSYVNMTGLTLNEHFAAPNAIHGPTTLERYFHKMLKSS